MICQHCPATSPLPAHKGILRKSKEIQQNPSPIGPIGTQINLFDTTDTSTDLETMRKRLRAVDLPYLYPPCRSRCLLPTPTGPHPAPPGPPVPHTRTTVVGKCGHTGPTSVGAPTPTQHTHTHTHTQRELPSRGWRCQIVWGRGPHRTSITVRTSIIPPYYTSIPTLHRLGRSM